MGRRLLNRPLPGAAARIPTFVFVCIGWVFFALRICRAWEFFKAWGNGRGPLIKLFKPFRCNRRVFFYCSRTSQRFYPIYKTNSPLIHWSLQAVFISLSAYHYSTCTQRECLGLFITGSGMTATQTLSRTHLKPSHCVSWLFRCLKLMR